MEAAEDLEAEPVSRRGGVRVERERSALRPHPARVAQLASGHVPALPLRGRARPVAEAPAEVINDDEPGALLRRRNAGRRELFGPRAAVLARDHELGHDRLGGAADGVVHLVGDVRNREERLVAVECRASPLPALALLHRAAVRPEAHLRLALVAVVDVDGLHRQRRLRVGTDPEDGHAVGRNEDELRGRHRRECEAPFQVVLEPHDVGDAGRGVEGVVVVRREDPVAAPVRDGVQRLPYVLGGRVEVIRGAEEEDGALHDRPVRLAADRPEEKVLLLVVHPLRGAEVPGDVLHLVEPEAAPADGGDGRLHARVDRGVDRHHAARRVPAHGEAFGVHLGPRLEEGQRPADADHPREPLVVAGADEVVDRPVARREDALGPTLVARDAGRERAPVGVREAARVLVPRLAAVVRVEARVAVRRPLAGTVGARLLSAAVHLDEGGKIAAALRIGVVAGELRLPAPVDADGEANNIEDNAVVLPGLEDFRLERDVAVLGVDPLPELARVAR